MVMKKFIAVSLTLILTFMLVPTENLHAETTTQSFTLYYTDPEDENNNMTVPFTVTGTSKSYVFCSITRDGSHCWVASKDQFALSGLESLSPIQLYVGYSEGDLVYDEVASIDPSVDIKMYITGIGEYSPETISFDNYIVVKSIDIQHLLETLIRYLDTGYSAGFDFSNAKSYKSCTEVEAHITEQWTVTLPTSISLGGSTSKDYNITVKGDVLDESTVTVVPDSSFKMTDLFSRSLTATVAQSESIWTASEINAASGTTHSGTISLESLPAGSWSGNLNFNVGVGFVPGLYTLEGTLSKSWQELLDEGTIHVTDGALTTNYVYNEETGDRSNASADALVGRLVIPDSVTSLDISAFAYCSNLTSVRIPDSVMSIGNGAFSGCTSLQLVKIPDSVTSIGESAFQFCTSLQSLTIQDGAKSIGDYAFKGCTSLQSLTLPDSVTSIGESAFESCTSLQSIAIPGSVTDIGEFAFYECTSLKSVTILDSVTNISRGTFYGCTSLQSVVIPNSVTSIGVGAFFECTSLQSLTIPNSVTMIGNLAFKHCKSLKTVTIPDSVISIGNDAFSECTGLQSVALPDSITSIGESAFEYCESLNAITIPDRVTSIEGHAFRGCTSLQSVTIPDSVTSVGEYAFYNCTSLQSLTLPNSITMIGERAFEYCKSLNTITIPNSVTDLGRYAFWGCSSLQSVALSDSITSILGDTFRNCVSLKSIVIPGNIKTIYSYAFEGCENLKSVVFEEGVEKICSSAFEGCCKLKTIHIPDSVTSVDSMAFQKCTGIESISVGSNNPKYDSRDNCNAILEKSTGKLIVGCKNTNIPEGTVSLASYAFCASAPNNLYIPASLTGLNADKAFNEHAVINTIIVDPDNSKYDSRNDCNAVIETSSNILVLGCSNTIIPNTVVSIGYEAFYKCTELTEMRIPDSITSIGSFAFEGCTSLSNLDVPSTVTTIYDDAFKNVPNVNYTGSATGSPWGAKAINGVPVK